MIKSSVDPDGKKATPRQYAKEVIALHLESACFWPEDVDSDTLGAMTDREREQVRVQINKIVRVIRKHQKLPF